MAKNDSYAKYRSRRGSFERQLSLEFEKRLSELQMRLAQQVTAANIKTKRPAVRDEDKTAKLQHEYRRLELGFFNEVYGKSKETIFGFDQSWDRFVRNEAKESGDDRFLLFHANIQSERLEAASDHWAEFLATGSTEALHEYILRGGEITPVVREAIIAAIPPKSHDADFRRYETALEVQQILKDYNFEISVSAACDLLAQKQSDDAQQQESDARKFRHHIKKFERKTGFKMASSRFLT